MSWIDKLLGLGFDIKGAKDLSDQLRDFGTQAQAGAFDVGQETYESSQFTPFTVTSDIGNVNTSGSEYVIDPETGEPAIDPQTGEPIKTGFGGVSYDLSPDQKALQDSLFGGSQALANQATAAYDPVYEQLANQAYGGVGNLLTQAQTASEAAGSFDRATREQDVYGRIRGLQTPEEERQRLALEQRLASQGRLGVSTNQFGGTPEQLAMAKAQAEAQNQAGLMSMQRASQEQQEAQANALALQGLAGGMFGLGTTARRTPREIQALDLQNLGTMMDASYSPQAQLLNAFQPAVNLSNIATTARSQGAKDRAQSKMSGIEAALQAEIERAQINRQAMASASDIISGGMGGGGLFSSVLEGASRLPSWIKNLFGDEDEEENPWWQPPEGWT